MKTLTKILSAFLAGCMLFTLCACHGKDETALTIEDEEITSALYLNALIECDSDARSLVDEEIAAKEEENASEEDAATEEKTDYLSYTMQDGTNFVDYVKSKAFLYVSKETPLGS